MMRRSHRHEMNGTALRNSSNVMLPLGKFGYVPLIRETVDTPKSISQFTAFIGVALIILLAAIGGHFL